MAKTRWTKAIANKKTEEGRSISACNTDHPKNAEVL